MVVCLALNRLQGGLKFAWLILLMQLNCDGFSQTEVSTWVNYRNRFSTFSGSEFIPTVLARHQVGKNIISGGFQLERLTLNNHKRPVFGLHYQRMFDFRNEELKAGFMWVENRYTIYSFARHLIADIQSDKKKFKYRVGYHTILFMLTPKAKEQLDIKQNTTLVEWHNIIYEIAYFFRENESRWNAGIELKNIDFLFVNQSSSPMFSGKIIHQPNEQWLLFSELRGQRPGMMNLSSDRLHYLIRFGITWRAKK